MKGIDQITMSRLVGDDCEGVTSIDETISSTYWAALVTTESHYHNTFSIMAETALLSSA
jgi:hypothetical protein